MTIRNSVVKYALAAALGYSVLAGGSWIDVQESASLVSEAQAIVGRPLTPVSYAGVARRTTRRCISGVYYC
ncbi:hypothetical protein K1W69_06735 [Hoeflea sp. WL0058]|uniref:Uncharacterized protein n=1 Tax=Flavimaribacter sediminis TaxID=2865987 RepID=A0AAE3D0N1_9HYPH|nr:hypothetical protein [Flavimaribacter sediminis]MBW8636878.1 hypothetical protein [Flavimaribacter sediminis]